MYAGQQPQSVNRIDIPEDEVKAGLWTHEQLDNVKKRLEKNGKINKKQIGCLKNVKLNRLNRLLEINKIMN